MSVSVKESEAVIAFVSPDFNVLMFNSIFVIVIEVAKFEDVGNPLRDANWFPNSNRRYELASFSIKLFDDALNR